jgi:sialate O-acetylesterase
MERNMMRIFKYCITGVCIAVFGCAGPVRAAVRLPAIFSDHMVLQKADRVPVWGWAQPGEGISVTLNGQIAVATANSEGKWNTTLGLQDSPPGPFEMTIQGNTDTVTVRDIVVGEVWLASGQSNMEQMMFSQKHAEEETATADNPMLRQFITIKTVSLSPQENVEGFWLKVAPGQTSTMTALGYYFSKELHQALQRPVGIIKASWGGLKIEKFIQPESYDLAVQFRNTRAARQKDVLAKAETFVQWMEGTGRTDQTDMDRELFLEDVASEVNGWVHVNDKENFGHTELPHYGAVWFRKEIILAAAQCEVPQYLFLGYHDIDFVDIYFNGELVEQVDMEDYTTFSRLTSRIYITTDLMKEGVNQLALRVFAPHKRFSFAWAPMLNGRSVAGGWMAKAEYGLPELSEESDPPPSLSSLLTVDCAVYDGMIRPLISYAVKGVLWYQGESNVNNANAYCELMPLLINSWRSGWENPGMPFYYCQLANYSEKKDQPEESKWAELREAQLMTLSVPDTGMAVLIDTGESKDIHPQSKDVAGARLARIALSKAYGVPIPCSGPIFESLSAENGKIRLRFSHVGGGLVAEELPEVYWVSRKTGETAPLSRNSPGSELEGFAICGKDRNWVWADAKIDGDTVLVWSDGIRSPVAVRYAWADNPTCNLYSDAGLPASPFQAELPLVSQSILFSFMGTERHAVSVGNDFSGENSDYDTDASVSIEDGFVLKKAMGGRDAMARRIDGKVQLGAALGEGSLPGRIGLIYKGLELKNANPRESFTVKGEITTLNTANGSYQNGLTLNHQADGRFYTARMNTRDVPAGAVSIMQFSRVDGAAQSNFAEIINSQPLVVASAYNLEISSSSPGVFDYTLTGANLDGGRLTGTVTDPVWKLESGYAGFYASTANTSVRFDNLYIQVR